MPKTSHYDQLSKAIKLHNYRDTVALVGGGGKTSIMTRLAEELHYDHGKRVLLTTTTHIENLKYDLVRMPGVLTKDIIDSIEAKVKQAPVVIAKRQVKGGKLKGITTGQAAMINRDVSFDYMLIEADGSAKKSLKAHQKYEPAIPQCTTFLIVVIGYDIIGKKLNINNVHRPQILSRLINKPLNSIIVPEDIINILKHPGGLLKGRPAATRTAVFLTKVKEHQLDNARKLSTDILYNIKGINSVLCGDINKARQLMLFS